MAKPQPKNIISEPFNHNYTIDIIQINHYSGKSIEEWYEKYYRGNADSDLRITIPDNLHSQNNDIIDNYIIDKYLSHVERNRLLAYVNWEIYRALNPDLKKILSTPDEYHSHLINYSLNDNRHIHTFQRYPNFSISEYRKEREDLNYLDDFRLELYFLENQ